MNNVLIIGANGYLGSRLSIALANSGCQVVALVDRRFPYDSIKNTPNILTIEFVLEEIDVLNGDVFSDIDVLYHFAWTGVNASVRNEAELQVQNVLFGLKVMEFAERYNIHKVIVPGSAAELGCGETKITGYEKPAPSDMYSASKVATRYICMTYAKQHNVGLIWTLITSIYGPGRDDNNLISYTIKSLLNGEKPSTTKLEQKWDYLYVDDLIRALILLGEKGVCGKVYPIGSGEYRQMREYVEIIRNHIDSSLPIGIGDLPYKSNVLDNQMMDISQLTADTGFVPLCSFECGIKEVIKYYNRRP
jgi:nucleoside-diphosphate-sugar epimerase